MQVQAIAPIVIGTAGHIDHGKSSLVRALTGVDPDRLKEEQERGMTIDLGYAPLELPDGRTVGIIDVPGHERFVRNMVAGATGIDLVVLVVAADDGVMPQTREHLHIMQLLGVSRGFVALNKVDLVDAEMVEVAEDDVRSALKGTFLEGAPIVRVSATKGVGLDALKQELFRQASATEPRSAEGVFRMPIQRVFSARGFGTVVTGVPMSGSVEVGALLEVQPGGFVGKVRGLQAYGASVGSARAGHRTAINLADVPHEKVARGSVVASPGFFVPLSMVAARLDVLADLGRPVTNRMKVRLHTGTADPAGEVVVLDQESLAPGASGLVQLRLEEPVVCAPGDPYILRLVSPAITLGGGVILEESKHRLKRFKGFVIEELARQEQSLDSPLELAESILARAGAQPLSLADVAKAIKREPEETKKLLETLATSKRVRSLGSSGKWMQVERLEAELSRVKAAVDAWFAANAHRQVMEVAELRRTSELEHDALGLLLDEEARRGGWALESGGFLRPKGRARSLDEKTRDSVERVHGALAKGGTQPPTPAELATALALKPTEVQRVLELLLDEGRVKRVEKDFFLALETVERVKASIVANCQKHGHLEIPTLRDELQTSRKFLIPLLEWFDTQGLTIRQGANRVLRKR
ncbi:MAG: selenocysteine-specific translation elongation factor [Planctomycetes bacterium]|nr:selenocysteine-specific translation elongation factor [Planctomycetota bacterium]